MQDTYLLMYWFKIQMFQNKHNNVSEDLKLFINARKTYLCCKGEHKKNFYKKWWRAEIK